MKMLLLFQMFFLYSLAQSAEVRNIKLFEYPPYIYIEKGQIEGLFFEIMKESFNLAGIEANYSVVLRVKGMKNFYNMDTSNIKNYKK